MSAELHQRTINQFSQLIHSDAHLHQLYKGWIQNKAPGDPSSIPDKTTLVEMLVTQDQKMKQLFKRLEQLESIAPRKFTDKDGKVYVWQCPVALIPEATDMLFLPR